MNIHKMTVSDNMTLEKSTHIITDEIAAILGENLL